MTDLATDCGFERLPAYTAEIDLPYPVQASIPVENQAQLHLRRYCLALAAAIGARGGGCSRRRGSDVDAVSRSRVKTAHGELTADGS